MSGPNLKLADDLKTVAIRFATSPPLELKLTVPDIQDIFDKLGAVRSQMQPGITPDLVMGRGVKVISDPRWATEPERLLGNSLLHIRDPRFGWLHYMFSRDDARKLAQYLLAQAAAPSPTETQAKPN